LWNLVAGNISNKATVAEGGAIPRLVELLSSGSGEGRADLAAANTAVRVAVLAAGAIPLLVELLRNRSNEGRLAVVPNLR
jgi:hypothetical protein